MWKTSVMPYMKPSASKKSQIWMMDLCQGGVSHLSLSRLNLNFKILGEILVSHTLGGQSSFTMCRLNLNFKILVEILVGHTGGFNHLLPCAGWIWTLKFWPVSQLKLQDSACTWSKMIDPQVWLTIISPKFLKLRFSLHMVEDDWPPRYDWPVSHLKFWSSDSACTWSKMIGGLYMKDLLPTRVAILFG